MERSSSNILLVEDHADTATVIRRLLDRVGHRVRVAEGYAVARRVALQDGPFDLLLCDIGLPDGDGCDLLAEIREMYPVRAIAVTAYGMRRDVERCVHAGFDRHLLKPVDSTLLLSAIEQLTGPRPGGDEQPPAAAPVPT